MGPTHIAGNRYRGQINAAKVSINPNRVIMRDVREFGFVAVSSYSDAAGLEVGRRSNSIRSDVMKIPGSTVANARA